MSNHCMVTGAIPRSGNHVSHSHSRTKRRFMPNIQHKRYWLPSENRYVRLTVSAHGMKVVDARGIERVIRDLRRRGIRV